MVRVQHPGLKRMKTILRKASTGLYFQGPDKWTNNPLEAMNFKMIDRALDFIRKWNLQDMEVAFAFDRTDQVTRVPFEKIALGYAESQD
jgi:hypothetical protein